MKVGEIWYSKRFELNGKISFIVWSDEAQDNIIGVVDTWTDVSGDWDPKAYHILRPKFLKEHVRVK